MSSATWRAILVADSRLLWRDPLLAWVILLPVGLALFLRVLIPAIEPLLTDNGFTLSPYHSLIMSGYLMTAPGIVGMVVGFLLLDERDARTLVALRVTPLSMRGYLAYRMVSPLLLGAAATLIGYPIVGVTPLPIGTLLAIVAVGSVSAPILALVLATVAPNKVAGFAVVKVMNAVNLLPLVAYFISPPSRYVVGVLPPFWPMQALWSASEGEPIWQFLAVGILVAAIALWLSMTMFERRLTLRA